MKKWKDRRTVKKGDIGEDIVDKWLISKGYMPYRPAEEVSRPHPFDRLTASFDKRSLRIVEVKAKAKRQKYPDTGIDLRHYQDYMHVEARYGIGVFLAFVDEEAGRVYGNFISELSKELQVEHNGKMLLYPLEQNRIIYFPMKRMLPITKLTQDQMQRLSSFTTKNGRYIPQQ